MKYREIIEKREEQTLGKFACLSARTRGRKRIEEKDDLRTEFMRDRDRIIHSAAFRRLKHKTQVFLSPEHENYRTRLTHTLEVSQIARTISRALLLNEDLTEAIALGHDVGHTPFGHAGEDVIRELADPNFTHAAQSVRVLEVLEKRGLGLNLTLEVLDGIEKHSKTGKEIFIIESNDYPLTKEAEVVRISDIIAYVNHDIDDAIASGLLKSEELPKSCREYLGLTHSQRVNTMVLDVIANSVDSKHIRMSKEMLEETTKLRNFLFQDVYKRPALSGEIEKAKHLLFEIYHFLINNMEIVYREIDLGYERRGQDNPKRDLIDFLAFITDHEAMRIYYNYFIPKSFFMVNL